jgi:hypothetical protein
MKQAAKKLPSLEKGWDTGTNLSADRARRSAYEAMLKAARHNEKHKLNPFRQKTAASVYKKLGMGGRRRKTRRRRRRRRKRTRRRRR